MKFKSYKGFSLIELLIAMALITILAAVASPYFTKYRYNTNLKEAARTISGDIQLYKQKAVTENIGYRINFNESTNEYTIQKETALNSGSYNNLNTRKVAEGYSNIVLSDPSFAGGASYVTFNQRGTSTAGHVILTHDKTSSTANITTTIMGRVKVKYELK